MKPWAKPWSVIDSNGKVLDQSKTEERAISRRWELQQQYPDRTLVVLNEVDWNEWNINKT